MSRKQGFKKDNIIICALIALFIPLSYLSFIIPIINAKITLQNLPIYIAGILYGPIYGAIVGAMGMLISQILQYGIEITTILWIIPQTLLGLIVGLLSKSRILDYSKKSFIIYMIILNIMVTILNTIVLYIDSIIKNYNQYILGISFIGRIISSIIFALILYIIIPYIIKAIQKIKQ